MTSGGPIVIFAEVPGRKPIGSAAALKAAAYDCETISVSGVTQALATLKSCRNVKIFVTNEPSLELFETAVRHSPNVTRVLVTDLPMAEYCRLLEQRDLDVLDHIIANLDSDWTTSDLAITLQKLTRRDFFGIEKYLSPDSQLKHHTIRGSSDRDICNKKVQDWVEACGLGKNIGRLAYGVCEELLMNAIYDAPVAGGRKHYDEMERHENRTLAVDEWAMLRYGIDGRLFAISISDPFGAFARDKWFSYLRKALKRDDSEALIDTKKSGAGLGLFKMLYSSHAVVCNVDPGKLTEVIILISLNHPVRDFAHMPRSIHYFNTSMR
jgi:hypothetical protein